MEPQPSSEVAARVEERYPGARIESSVQGWVYLEDFERGVDAYSRIEHPTADDERWVGVCHFQQVEDAEAQGCFERAIAGGQQAARVNLAHLLRMSDRADRAEDELQKVDFARLTSYDQVFFLRVKSIHEEANGNVREALRYAEEAWRRLQGLPEFPILAPSILSQLGILHGRIGRAQRALWFLERGIQLTEGIQQQKARIRWVTVLVAQGRIEDAEHELDAIDTSTLPEPTTVELPWLRAEIGLMQGHLGEAQRHFARAVEIAKHHQVVYEEFLCQLGLATLHAFSGRFSSAMDNLGRAQELISDRSDQLAFRFREILVYVASGAYRREHGVRELGDVASSFGDMGLLQEQGFVRFHIARLKAELGDSSLDEELDALVALGKSLQNPGFLRRELGFAPSMAETLRHDPRVEAATAAQT